MVFTLPLKDKHNEVKNSVIVLFDRQHYIDDFMEKLSDEKIKSYAAILF